MTSKSPAEVLFSGYHRRILALLLLRPDRSFYVREIARLTGVPAGSLHRELRALAESGLLLREPYGNQVRYRADPGCPVYPELASFFRKTAGLADVLREALRPLSGEIDLAFIFGSVAKGAEKTGSDVDLFVAGAASFADVVKALSTAQEQLGREVNPVVMTTKDFSRKLAQGDRFLARIVKEPRILLLGTTDEPGKPAPNRPAG